VGATLYDERRDTFRIPPLDGLRCLTAVLTLLAEMGDIDKKSELTK
jgi:hypothetical protein